MMRRIVILATAALYALAFMLFILSMAAWYANELNRPRDNAPSDVCEGLPPSYGDDC